MKKTNIQQTAGFSGVIKILADLNLTALYQNCLYCTS